MASPNLYFFLSEGKVLVDGIKNSVILDLLGAKIYRVNASAKRIIELGEQGLKKAETIQKLNPEPEASDVLYFINELVDQGLILLSADPKPQSSENWPSPKLDFLWIEVTPRCNLRCVHCYAEAEAEAGENKQPSGLLTEEIKRVMEEAAALGCRRLQLTGGEPTLRGDLRELIGYAKARGFEFIEIFTNGTLLTEPMISFFKEAGVHVAISIYSYSPQTHETITRVPGSFERTLNSLKLLLAYGVPTRCAVVAMKQNEDDLDGTSYFLSQLRVLDKIPDPIRPSGRGKTMENWPQKYGLRFMQTQPLFLVSQENYEKNRRWNSCWFGKAAVTGLGDVLPCVFARDQVAGNVKKQSLAEIILGERMLSFWSLTKDQVEGCRDCEYRYVCEDCRPWACGFTSNLYAKSPRCTYNPYTGEWAKAEERLRPAGGCVGREDSHI